MTYDLHDHTPEGAYDRPMQPHYLNRVELMGFVWSEPSFKAQRRRRDNAIWAKMDFLLDIGIRQIKGEAKTTKRLCWVRLNNTLAWRGRDAKLERGDHVQLEGWLDPWWVSSGNNKVTVMAQRMRIFPRGRRIKGAVVIDRQEYRRLQAFVGDTQAPILPRPEEPEAG